MIRMGFEPTIPLSERAKTFKALDYAATKLRVQVQTLPKKRSFCFRVFERRRD